jgi:hypothetical protein
LLITLSLISAFVIFVIVLAVFLDSRVFLLLADLLNVQRGTDMDKSVSLH